MGTLWVVSVTHRSQTVADCVADRRRPLQIIWKPGFIWDNCRYNNKQEAVLLCFNFTCTLWTLIIRFSKVLTWNTFTFFQSQPELVLKLFLIFGQSEPRCSYKVVLIKKVCKSNLCKRSQKIVSWQSPCSNLWMEVGYFTKCYNRGAKVKSSFLYEASGPWSQRLPPASVLLSG